MSRLPAAKFISSAVKQWLPRRRSQLCSVAVQQPRYRLSNSTRRFAGPCHAYRCGVVRSALTT